MMTMTVSLLRRLGESYQITYAARRYLDPGPEQSASSFLAFAASFSHIFLSALKPARLRGSVAAHSLSAIVTN
jgi:hypothetical protein